MTRKKNSNPENIAKLANSITQKLKEMEEKTEAFKEGYRIKLKAHLEGQENPNLVGTDILSDSVHAVNSKQKSIRKDFEKFKFNRYRKLRNHLLNVSKARRDMLNKVRLLEKRNKRKNVSISFENPWITAERVQHGDGQASNVMKPVESIIKNHC